MKGQKAITHAQGLLNMANEWSVNKAVIYEEARQALWELGDDKDVNRYQALKLSDTTIKGMYGRKQLGDGWKTDSWIMEFGKRNTDDSGKTEEWEEEGKFPRKPMMISQLTSEFSGGLFRSPVAMAESAARRYAMGRRN